MERRESVRAFPLAYLLDFKVLSLSGSKDERAEIIANLLIPRHGVRCISSRNRSSKSSRSASTSVIWLPLVLYVIILSAALDPVPPSTPKGIILFCNIAPSLSAKVAWTYILKGRNSNTICETFIRLLLAQHIGHVCKFPVKSSLFVGFHLTISF